MIPFSFADTFFRYGYEIARLGNARNEAMKAQDTGRRGRVTTSVQEDTQVYAVQCVDCSHL